MLNKSLSLIVWMFQVFQEHSVGFQTSEIIIGP